MIENDFCIITTTCSSDSDRDRIIQALLDNRLAACIQVQEITSHYVWKGQTEHTREYLLLIKTRRPLYEKVQSVILANHSYEVPEILMLPILDGHTPYLKWIYNSTGLD